MNAKNIFGAITVGIALFFLWPGVFTSWSQVQALQAALVERQQLNADRTDILTKAKAEYAKYQAIAGTEEGKNLLSLVPVHKDNAELVSAVQDIANQAALQVAQFQVIESPQTAGAQYRTMSLVMELTGSYTGLRTFLTNLEAYVRILNVRTVQVSADAAEGQLKFTIRADTYFIK